MVTHGNPLGSNISVELSEHKPHKENTNHIDHTYQVDCKVLVRLNEAKQKWKLNCPFAEPFFVTKVIINGTIEIYLGKM